MFFKHKVHGTAFDHDRKWNCGCCGLELLRTRLPGLNPGKVLGFILLSSWVAGCVPQTGITHIPGKAFGPYSSVTRSGNLIFVSGQVGIDPETGEFGDVEQQTRYALKNLEAALSLVGAGRDAILKVTIYLARAEDMAVMNAVYAEFFSEHNYPARSTIPGADWGGRILIEIDAIARANPGE